MTYPIFKPATCLDNFLFDITHHFLGRKIEEHGHSCIEITIVAKGTADHWLNGSYKRVYPGCVIVILPGGTHRFENAKGLEVFNLSCPPELFVSNILPLEFLQRGKQLFSLSGESSLFTLYGTVFSDVCNLLNQMHEAFNHPETEEQHLLLRTWFIILIVILIQAWQPNPEKSGSSLELTIAYMEEHYSENLLLEDLARRTKMSRNQFIYKFRRKMGTTPCQYLIDLRLKHACVLLEKQEMSTEEIAFACGFCDGNYLRKIYRQRFGTPVNRRAGKSKKDLRFQVGTREAEKD